MSRRRLPAVLVPLVALTLALAGCGGSDTPAVSTSVAPPVSSTASSSSAAASSTSSSASSSATSAASSAAPTSAAGALSGSLTIYAATSLKAAFNDLGAKFIAANPGVTLVPITYDGSKTLATQLTGGAVGDIFASADEANMKLVTDAGLGDGTPQLFATNTLQIAVKPGNPLGITGLADLVKPGVVLTVCDTGQPCGSAAEKAFAAAGVTIPESTPRAQNVGAALTAVAGGGGSDASLVYRTDIKNAAAGTVEGVDFPESSSAINRYPITVLKDSTNKATAEAFAAYVTSAEGEAVLAGYGFAPPPAG